MVTRSSCACTQKIRSRASYPGPENCSGCSCRRKVLMCVSIFYDPMIAKLVVWDRTRDAALQRMREALAQCDIAGPKSNIDFLERLVRHPAVIEGRIDTGYLDRHLDEFLPADAAPDAAILFIAATAVLLDEEARAPMVACANDPHSPWSRADAWRLGHPGKRIVCFTHAGQRLEIDAHGAAGTYALTDGKLRCQVSNALLRDGVLSAAFDGIARRFQVRVDDAVVLLHDGDQRRRLLRVGAFAYTRSAGEVGDRVLAPMPGRVVLVKTKVGEKVTAGQELIVMEAMKMELTLRAPCAATITELRASAGEFVEADAILTRFHEIK